MKKNILLIFFFMTVACFSVMPLKAQSINSPVQMNFESESRKSAQISINVFNNKLYVNHAPENALLEIRNMLGEKVFEMKINSEKEEIYLDLKKGFYIVKIENTLQRIVIK
jgi:hypothetical protein